MDQLFKFAYELWLLAVVLMLGLGPGTALLRRWALPAYCWLPLTLASACLLSYGLFWIYFLDPATGSRAAVICWCASAIAFVWQLRQARRAGAGAWTMILRDRDAWLPGLLMVLLTIAYLFVLFARDAPVNYRFTWPLPPDNLIPQRLAARIASETVPSAPSPSGFLLSDWLTSDRPPLQAAVALAVRPFTHAAYLDLSYQVVGTMCQMGWVVALYALARTLELTRRATAYALAGCAFSGFFLLNSVYTWPKLLAGWLFVFALVLMIRATQERAAMPRLLLPIAALLALSLLAHGGVLFSLLALPVMLLPLRDRPPVTLRRLGAAAMVFVALLAAWLAYQRYYDPPGNRLLKLHLAGVERIDARGTWETIVDQYSTWTPETYLASRWANVRQQVALDPRTAGETLADWIRRQQFFHHAAALDALGLGLIAWWLRRGTPAADASARLARRLCVYALVTIGVWCLVMFTPGSAVVHQGSYAASMLLFFCAGAGLARLSRSAGAVALVLHVLLFVGVWLVADQTNMAATQPSWRPLQAGSGALLLLAFALAVWAVPGRLPGGVSVRPDARTG